MNLPSSKLATFVGIAAVVVMAGGLGVRVFANERLGSLMVGAGLMLGGWHGLEVWRVRRRFRQQARGAVCPRRQTLGLAAPAEGGDLCPTCHYPTVVEPGQRCTGCGTEFSENLVYEWRKWIRGDA